MSITDPPEQEATPDPAHISIAREAEHCVVFARADGDAVAAAGILASACQAAGTSVQACVVRTRRDLRRRLDAVDPDATPLVIGTAVDDAASVSREILSPWAFEVATQLDADPDPVHALAGVLASGADPATATPALLDAADLDPTAGVAIATADVIDGLAHSTLVHFAGSGDREQTRAMLSDVETESSETLASWLALTAAGTDGVPDRAASAIERVLHPYRIGGPFQTLGGYADVLDAVTRDAPGAAIGLAFDGGPADEARSIWRDRSKRVHRAVREAEWSRRQELAVASVSGPVEPTARLLRDFRVEAPSVLAVDDQAIGVAGTDATAGESLVTAAESVDGTGIARGRTGYAEIPDGELESVLAALEETV